MTGTLDEESALSNVFSSSDMGAESAAPGVSDAKVEAPAQADPLPEQIVKTADEVKDDEAPLQGRDPQTGRFVPVTELVAERKKLRGEKEAEARLRMEAEAQAKVFREQLESLQSQFVRNVQPPQERQEAPRQQVPDPVLDPEGFAAYQQAYINNQFQAIRLNMAETTARMKYTDAVVDSALQAAHQAGIAHRFKEAAQPYEALVSWHKRQQVDAEIGGDLEAYKKRVADEAVAAALANLKAGGTPAAPSAQAQPQKFPTTLADHTAQGDQGAVLSEAAAISNVFARKRA